MLALAGLPGMPDRPFSDLESEDTWKAHRRELDKAWGDIEAKRLPSMRDFQTRELTGPAIEKSLVFYPFSGPDTLAPPFSFRGIQPTCWWASSRPEHCPPPASWPGKTWCGRWPRCATRFTPNCIAASLSRGRWTASSAVNPPSAFRNQKPVVCETNSHKPGDRRNVSALPESPSGSRVVEHGNVPCVPRFMDPGALQ